MELTGNDWIWLYFNRLGRTTEFVAVSAKSDQGIEDLLETIILTSDILELAIPDREARGLVL